MKLLTIETTAGARVHYIPDHDAATAAHAALKTAMSEWREFGNERTQLVTIHINASEVTHRVGSLVSIALQDAGGMEPVIIEAAVWDRDVRRHIDARLTADEPQPEGTP